MNRLLSAFASVVTLACIAVAHPAPGIAVDSKENIYFVDYTHDRIMAIAPDGSLSTFVDGAKEKRFSVPHHIFIDSQDNLFVASDRGGKIWRFSLAAVGTQLYPPLDWSGIDFIGSGGDPFTVDIHGNIYGTNARQFRFSQILRIDSRGLITSLAGNTIGHADGKGDQASFGELHSAAMTCDPTANPASAATLYLADTSCIRTITHDGTVTTFAGSTERANKDGPAKDARFNYITHLSWDTHLNLIVTDHGSASIKKIAPDGTVTTLPFNSNPKSALDSHPPAPINPTGSAIGPSGNIYTIDYPGGDNPRISRITPDGNSEILIDLDKPNP